MTWARVDDKFPRHPKVVAAGDRAAWLFIAGLCYCQEYLTDGKIPKLQVPALTRLKNAGALVAKLLATGLWEDDTDHYLVHDYLDWNEPATKVLARRKTDRLRRDTARNPAGHRPESSRTPPGIQPDDSRPHPPPLLVDSSSSSSNRVWSPEFDDDDFGKACWLLAERKLDTERLEGRGPTSNVERWLRSVYQHKRREHAQLLTGAGLLGGAAFPSAEELADHLEPAPRPKPEDAASRATLARYDRHDNPCESCGGSMLLEDDSFCPACHPQASPA